MHAQQGNGTFFPEFVSKMDPGYIEATPPAAIVCDFLAGMTDDYFLKQASLLGCPIPQKH
jgi:dGTPase